MIGLAMLSEGFSGVAMQTLQKGQRLLGSASDRPCTARLLLPHLIGAEAIWAVRPERASNSRRFKGP